MKPIANPNVADNTLDSEDPYVKGWNDGKKFAEERAKNVARLDAGGQQKLSCSIDRAVWWEACKVWQRETENPRTYMSPEELLRWLSIRIPELKYFNSWAEGQGHIKGFLEGKGIKVKTGEL